MASASHLRALQAVELAVRMGSLKGAADLLGITPAAVGQRIKTLEDYLGIDLLVRGRSGLQPTDALVKALPYLNNAFDELSKAADSLEMQRVNEIHITADPDWVELWLSPRLPEFRAAYPNALFCINGEGDAPVRKARDDVEICFDEVSEGENVDVLFKDYLTPISSPENEARIKKVRGKYPLEGFPLFELEFYQRDIAALNWRQWLDSYGQRKTAFNQGLCFQRVTAGLEAVKSNAGLLICGLVMVCDEVEKGAVTLPFDTSQGRWTEFAFSAVYKRNTLPNSALRYFRDWLIEEAVKTRDRLTAILSA